MNDREGYVYVMLNPSMPMICKVGRTTRDPEQRAKELSIGTGIAAPFVVAYSVKLFDCYEGEKSIHRDLEDGGFRVNSNREFFTAPLSMIIRLMEDIRLSESSNNFSLHEKSKQIIFSGRDSMYADRMRSEYSLAPLKIKNTSEIFNLNWLPNIIPSEEETVLTNVESCLREFDDWHTLCNWMGDPSWSSQEEHLRFREVYFHLIAQGRADAAELQSQFIIADKVNPKDEFDFLLGALKIPAKKLLPWAYIIIAYALLELKIQHGDTGNYPDFELEAWQKFAILYTSGSLSPIHRYTSFVEAYICRIPTDLLDYRFLAEYSEEINSWIRSNDYLDSKIDDSERRSAKNVKSAIDCILCGT